MPASFDAFADSLDLAPERTVGFQVKGHGDVQLPLTSLSREAAQCGVWVTDLGEQRLQARAVDVGAPLLPSSDPFSTCPVQPEGMRFPLSDQHIQIESFTGISFRD